MNGSNLLVIAKIGKTHGLFGELKLYILSDFPEQFASGATFYCENYGDLTIEYFDTEKETVKFKHINIKEDAAKLTNRQLYSSIQESEKSIPLKEDELFYHQAIGFNVIEEGQTIGSIIDIHRYGDTDYLEIVSAIEPINKTFLLPYIDRYVSHIDKEKKEIFAKDAISILEES